MCLPRFPTNHHHQHHHHHASVRENPEAQRAHDYQLAVRHAALLRALYAHPRIQFLEPPTPEIHKFDKDRTNPGVFFLADFVQNTYVKYILPLLPPGASRKCKELGNPWAYADASFPWEWTWDADTSTFKDSQGNAVPFPAVPQSERTSLTVDIRTRTMTVEMLIGDRAIPLQQQMMGLGGVDLGDDVKNAQKDVVSAF
ncbi:hypothetical protein B0I35DRAFT_475989 [Stachybotrys elegans]|uniref:Uncharacterized protein n=1 Tax=Stachybotrys elegans TaxID=80388 RepID=A0A8K0T1A0_9HYPO|nr:hypothetical protein B0I35DRAFT_475989 [Stachybotrys elegans]